MQLAEALGTASQISRQPLSCHELSRDRLRVLSIGAHLEAPFIVDSLPKRLLCGRSWGFTGRQKTWSLPAWSSQPREGDTSRSQSVPGERGAERRQLTQLQKEGGQDKGSWLDTGVPPRAVLLSVQQAAPRASAKNAETVFLEVWAGHCPGVW